MDPCAGSLLISTGEVLPRPHAKLRVRAPPRVKPQQHAHVHGYACKDGGGVCGEAYGRQGPGAYELEGVDGLEAHDGIGQEGPDVAGQPLDDGGEEGGVPHVPAADDEDDDPEEGWVRIVAVIRVRFAEHGHEGVEAFKIPWGCLLVGGRRTHKGRGRGRMI